MPDFAEVLRPHLEGALDPGETLEGVCAAAQQSTFKGRALALGVTLQLKTTRGEKYKLNLMRGTGAFGKLGGEPQRQGIEALGLWFQRFAAGR